MFIHGIWLFYNADNSVISWLKFLSFRSFTVVHFIMIFQYSYIFARIPTFSANMLTYQFEI
jgi:hypothetical protein